MTPEEQESGETPVRRFRLEDRWWVPAVAKARAEGTTISAKIRGWIIGYVGGDDEDRDSST